MWFVLCEMKRHAEACAVSGTAESVGGCNACARAACVRAHIRLLCVQRRASRALLVFVCLIILVSAFVSESEI